MEEIPETESGDTSACAVTKPPSRNLFHYFGKTKADSPKPLGQRDPLEPAPSDQSAKKRKKPQQKKVDKEDQSPTLTINSPVKKKVRESSPETPKLPPSVAEEKKEDLEELPIETEELKPPKNVPAISCFFKKVTKDEYKKEMEMKNDSSVVVVQAMVHLPTPERTSYRADLKSGKKKAAAKAKKKKKLSTEDLEAADKIEVLAVKEVTVQENHDSSLLAGTSSSSHYEPADANILDSNPDSESVAPKISQTLWSKKKPKVPKDERRCIVTEDSVDVDFFRKSVATGNQEQVSPNPGQDLGPTREVPTTSRKTDTVRHGQETPPEAPKEREVVDSSIAATSAEPEERGLPEKSDKKVKAVHNWASIFAPKKQEPSPKSSEPANKKKASRKQESKPPDPSKELNKQPKKKRAKASKVPKMPDQQPEPIPESGDANTIKDTLCIKASQSEEKNISVKAPSVENEGEAGESSGKISTAQLFRKREPRKSLEDGSTQPLSPLASGHPPPIDDESVDFDFLQSNSSTRPRKDPSPEKKKAAKKDDLLPCPKEKGAKSSSSSSHRPSQVSPQLFKPSRATKRRKKPPVEGVVDKLLEQQQSEKPNYDSDSLDVDVLSSMSRRSFARQANGDPNSSIGTATEDEDNAFSALLREPLKKRKRTKKQVEADGDKSQLDPDDSDVPEIRARDKPGKKDEASQIEGGIKVEVHLEPRQEDGRKNKKRKKPVQKEKSINLEVDKSDAVESVEPVASESGRRSSRIQKNKVITDQKRKEQEDLERCLSEEIKAKPSKKQKRTQEKVVYLEKKDDEARDDDDADIIVEKIVLSPLKNKKTSGTTAKIASIFMKCGAGKKVAANPIKTIENPEVVAARKAFLMSSVPDTLRTQTSVNESEEDQDRQTLDMQMPFPDVTHVRQEEPRGSGLWKLGDIQEIRVHDSVVLKDERQRYPREKQVVEAVRETRAQEMKKLLSNSAFAVTIAEAAEEKKVKPNQARNQRKGGNKRKKKNVTQELGDVLEISSATLPEVNRMSSPQIYHFVKSLKMANDAFPINKIFRRYVERKIESDTLETEAREKNRSLDEIEEVRSTRGRRRMRRKSKKEAAKEEKEITSQLVKYDPNMQSSMQWTMKYAPQMAEDIIGNPKVVRALQDWLEKWTERQQRRRRQQQSSKKKRDASSEDEESDGSSWDSCSYDVEDEFDNDDGLANTAMLAGPSGIGKTSAVYALATQHGFKVLEVNASSVRGGRQVMSRLQEATQSHHVVKSNSIKAADRGGSSSCNNNSLKDVLAGKNDKSNLDKTALILFEDIDVVFEEQDDGFYSAVSGLIATTKRPIILTTSNLNFNPKKYLKTDPQYFAFGAISPRLTAQYIQLLALAEGFPVHCDVLTGLIELNAGSVAKSILDLQCWAMGGCGAAAAPVPEIYDTSNDGNSVSDEIKGESEDFLTKLMSIDGKQLQSCSAVRPFRGSPLEMLGLLPFGGNSFDAAEQAEDEKKKKPQVTEDVASLIREGLQDFYDLNRELMLPFTRVTKDVVSHKKIYPLGQDIPSESQQQKKFKRIMNLDRNVFSADSDDDGDDDVKETIEEEKKEAKSQIKPPMNAVEKIAFRTARRALEQLSNLAEISSRFSKAGPMSSVSGASSASKWWLPKSNNFGHSTHSQLGFADSEINEHSLAREMSAYVQSVSLARAQEAIQVLKDEKKTSGGEELSIPTDEGEESKIKYGVKGVGTTDKPSHGACDQEALNACLPDLTVNPLPMVLDLLPMLRNIARTEEVRRAGGGVKKSRSGRFLHYLDQQEIFIRPETLTSLCNDFV